MGLLGTVLGIPVLTDTGTSFEDKLLDLQVFGLADLGEDALAPIYYYDAVLERLGSVTPTPELGIPNTSAARFRESEHLEAAKPPPDPRLGYLLPQEHVRAALQAQGVVLTAADGRTAFNNQVPTRMLRRQREIRKLIYDVLFTGNQGA